MDLVEMGTQLLRDQLNINVDAATVNNALSQLLGDGTGGVDLAGLASSMLANQDLGAVLGSWLGDGANKSISADTITDLFGQEKVSKFASQVGVGSQEAAKGLADVIPQLMDKSSSGGSLLDQLGGAGGLLGAASSLFGQK